MTIRGGDRFRAHIEELFERIAKLGGTLGRWLLGENWPYSPQEFDGANGRKLNEARVLARGRAC